MAAFIPQNSPSPPQHWVDIRGAGVMLGEWKNGVPLLFPTRDRAVLALHTLEGVWYAEECDAPSPSLRQKLGG